VGALSGDRRSNVWARNAVTPERLRESVNGSISNAVTSVSTGGVSTGGGGGGGGSSVWGGNIVTPEQLRHRLSIVTPVRTVTKGQRVGEFSVRISAGARDRQARK
jgi:hypothetical protein